MSADDPRYEDVDSQAGLRHALQRAIERDLRELREWTKGKEAASGPRVAGDIARSAQALSLALGALELGRCADALERIADHYEDGGDL